MRLVVVVAGLFAAARALAWMTPPPAVLVETLRQPEVTAEAAGIDVVVLAAAGAACWLALTWLVVALAASAAASLPGRCGSVAGRVAGATIPPSARRLVALAVGFAVIATPGVTPATASPLPPSQVSTTTPDLDWPVTSGPPVTPVNQASRKPSTPAEPRAVRSAADVVVQPGDSLWSIARQHLPAGGDDSQTAAEWPRWYAINRAVVGSDPDLLLPGQRLHPPVNPPGGQP